MNTKFQFSVIAALLLIGITGCPSIPREQSEDIPRPPETAVPEVPAEEPEEPSGTEGILVRISRLLERRDFDGAVALFEEIDPEERETSAIRLLKASVLSSAGRGAEGRVIVNAIISQEPENVEALYVLSGIEAAEGKEREQRLILERVIKADPLHIAALTDLGAIAFRGRSFRTAASYYDRVLAVDPNHREALIGRAGVYRYSREPKKAEALLNQAVQLYPGWAVPLSERARLYRDEGFPKQALADLDKARELDGSDYWISCDRGIVLIDLNRKQEALAEFSRAVSLGPDNFLAYVYTAGIKDEIGDLDGAEQDYEILVKLRPDYYFAFEGLGMHKMRKHQWAEARNAFQEAYNRAPQENSYALLAAVNWMRAGRQSDPRQFLDTVLRKVERETPDWYMLRLFRDLAGDTDVAMRIDRESRPRIKAKMLFYLAQFYDIRGNTNLADRYFLQVKDTNQRGIPEWRLNEWILTERNLKVN